MRYLPEHKITFIHNPKTAGTSISQWLDDNFETVAGRKHGNHAEVSKFFPNSKFSFGVVRNPWSRLVSWYKFAGHGSGSFERWFMDRLNTHQTLGFSSNLMWARQWYSLTTPQTEWFNNDTHIIKLEQLATEFEYIQQMLDCDRQLPVSNVTIVSDYTKYYNEDLIELVRDIYLEDIIRFGYEFGI